MPDTRSSRKRLIKGFFARYVQGLKNNLESYFDDNQPVEAFTLDKSDEVLRRERTTLDPFYIARDEDTVYSANVDESNPTPAFVYGVGTVGDSSVAELSLRIGPNPSTLEDHQTSQAGAETFTARAIVPPSYSYSFYSIGADTEWQTIFHQPLFDPASLEDGPQIVRV